MTQPDDVGLNDIDMLAFTDNGSFVNLTPYIDKLPYESALSPVTRRLLAGYPAQATPLLCAVWPRS